MTLTVKTKHRSMPHLTYHGCKQDTIQIVPATVKSVESNPADHRPKPENLFENMTSLPIQYTHYKHYGSYTSAPASYFDGYCSPPIFSEYTSSGNIPYDPFPFFYWQMPLPNWQLKARLQVKDLKVSLGESLAEYRQTGSMFGSFAEVVGDVTRCIRRRRRCRSPQGCDVSAAELISSFGLSPLLGDLHASVEQLNSRLVEPIWQKISGSMDRVEEGKSPCGGWAWNVNSRYRIWFQTEASARGFTAGNPAEIAWELTPWSFVIDWGIPIGDYLSSIDALVGVNNTRGTVTHKAYYDSSCDGTGWMPTGHVCDRETIHMAELHRRDLVSSIPFARFPSYSPSMTWKRVMHSLSLLHQAKASCKELRRMKLK